jgi:cAMP-dependent protein kinase regulator|eukprot:g7151.t1
MADSDDTLQAVHDYVKVNDINALYVDMTEQMLMYKPENPIRFIVDYLTHKYPQKVTTGRYIRSVDETKGEDGISWTWQDEAPEKKESGGNGLGIDSDSEDDEDDFIDELPAFKPKKQRAAISATVTKLADDFTPTKIEKTNDQRERLLAILTSNKFFSKLEAEQREMMADALAPITKSDGDVIIQQGDAGDNFYILDEGIADVYVSKNGGEEEKVFTYEEGSGAAFGELALLYNAPRAATVKAVGAVKLWALDQDTFRYSMQAATTAFREQNAKWISNIPLLSELTETERLTIADAMQVVSLAAGEQVIKQGDTGDNFYIVRSGQCKCTINSGNEEIEVLQVEEGGYFGEIALLTDQPRKANVYAVSDCKLLSTDRATFKRVMGPLTDILSRNMDMYKKVLQDVGL